MAGRREEILRTAARLFAARGFHGVGMDEIGAEIGVSGPSLYHHFPSKEAILAEMLVSISETLLSEGRRRAEQAAPAGGAGGALAALIGWHVEFALAEPDLITVQARDLSTLPAEVEQRVRTLQRRYVGLWATAITEATGADLATSRAAAHAVFGLLNSTPHSARLPKDRMAEVLEHMGRGAIASLAPPAKG